MGVGRFEDLTAYRSATSLADDLRKEVERWSSIDQWTIGVQLLRAADSIGANIAEGMGRHGFRDPAKFLRLHRAIRRRAQTPN